MKTQTTGLFNTLSAVQLVSLTAEVKETIAMGLNYSFSKKITAADVWNIQRNKRSIVQRRYSL